MTAAMSGHEVGAYHLIIAQLWKSGGAIPADEDYLARLTKATSKEWRRIKQTLWPLFDIKDGLLTHGPTTEEIGKARKNREQRRKAGIASAESKRLSAAERKAAEAQRPFNGRSTDVATNGERHVNETPTARQPRAGKGEGPFQGITTSKDSTDTRGPFSVGAGR
ncbi:DUF1376 domain-containing protein [Novosphingobium sp. FGD1]|uniref:DUF1376 domain-containing protein n=2 Tax=Novosphingobium silvae TaxID=2692619 RepID=A0A7X4K6J2_9SPHN|nr:DUF1376 domain-containing protein [Novosphingobium silvae]